MFIIERRTAGVLAALVTTAAMAVLGNVWDRFHEVERPATADSTVAFATPLGPDGRQNRYLAGGQAGCVQASGTEPQAAPRRGCLARAASELTWGAD